jgi:hypothetical protein
MHLDAGHVLAPHRRLCFDEGHGFAIMGAPQSLQQLHAKLACTEDDDRLALGVGGKVGETDPRALQKHGGDLAAAGDHQRCQEAIAQHHGARDDELPGHEHEQRPDQHRQPDAADDAHVAAIAEIARDQPVKAGQSERSHGDDRSTGQHQRGKPVRRQVGGVVADRDRDPQRQAEQQQVEGDEYESLVEARQPEQPRAPSGQAWMKRTIGGHLPPRPFHGTTPGTTTNYLLCADRFFVCGRDCKIDTTCRSRRSIV